MAYGGEINHGGNNKACGNRKTPLATSAENASENMTQLGALAAWRGQIAQTRAERREADSTKAAACVFEKRMVGGEIRAGASGVTIAPWPREKHRRGAYQLANSSASAKSVSHVSRKIWRLMRLSLLAPTRSMACNAVCLLYISIMPWPQCASLAPIEQTAWRKIARSVKPGNIIW